MEPDGMEAQGDGAIEQRARVVFHKPHEPICSSRAGKTAAGWGGGGEAASGGWDRKAGNGREGERGINGGRRGEERGGGGEEWMGGIGRDKIERKMRGWGEIRLDGAVRERFRSAGRS